MADETDVAEGDKTAAPTTAETAAAGADTGAGAANPDTNQDVDPTVDAKPVTAKQAEANQKKNAKAEEDFEDDLPRNAATENFRGEVAKAPSGAVVVQVSPVGWVGEPPLRTGADRIDELIDLLQQLK